VNSAYSERPPAPARGFDRGWLALPALAACVAVGTAVALSPTAALATAAALTVLTVFFVRPAWTLAVVLVFLVVQDPLEVLFERNFELGYLVKRADIPLVLLIGTLALGFASVRRVLAGHRGLLVAVLATLATLAASTFVARPLWRPAALDLALIWKSIVLVPIGILFDRASADAEALFRRTMMALTAVCLTALPLLLSPGLLMSYLGDSSRPDYRIGMISAQGFFLNAGTFSWFAGATFCVALAGYLARLRGPYLWYTLSAGAMVVLSWRRKSILAIVFVLLISVIVTGRASQRARALALVGIAAVVALTVLAPYLVQLTEITVDTYGSANPMQTARHALYSASWTIASEHMPLGTGLGTFGSYASRYFYSELYFKYGIANIYGLSPQHPYFINDAYWPMLLAEGGVLCPLAFFAALLIAMRSAWRAIAEARGGARHDLALHLAVLFLLAASALESVASAMYSSTLPAALVFVPLGMHLSRTWSARARSGDVLPPR